MLQNQRPGKSGRLVRIATVHMDIAKTCGAMRFKTLRMDSAKQVRSYRVATARTDSAKPGCAMWGFVNAQGTRLTRNTSIGLFPAPVVARRGSPPLRFQRDRPSTSRGFVAALPARTPRRYAAQDVLCTPPSTNPQQAHQSRCPSACGEGFAPANPPKSRSNGPPLSALPRAHAEQWRLFNGWSCSQAAICHSRRAGRKPRPLYGPGLFKYRYWSVKGGCANSIRLVNGGGAVRGGRHASDRHRSVFVRRRIHIAPTWPRVVRRRLSFIPTNHLSGLSASGVGSYTNRLGTDALSNDLEAEMRIRTRSNSKVGPEAGNSNFAVGQDGRGFSLTDK